MSGSRAILIGLTALGVTAIVSSGIAEFAPKIVYNGSPSLPVGFYLVTPLDRLRRDDFVVVPVPETYEKLTFGRGYLAPGALLIKRVAALPGDHVCVLNGTVLINGRPVARAFKVDSRDRLLPVREGCQTLAKDEFFALIEEVQASFDSRYFGPLKLDSVVGKAHTLWTITGPREPNDP